jgi:type VI secretion system FHA domain protein
VQECISTAVVSWQTHRHVVRTAGTHVPGGSGTPEESTVLSPPAPVRPAWTPRSVPVQDAPSELEAGDALRRASLGAGLAVQPSFPFPEPARPPACTSAEARELASAFGRGAGVRAEAVQVTPEWMEHLGALLRESAEGILALLQSRAVAKRHMRAEGTHIAARQNNPLKFAPDATEALGRMLQREPSPGFLDPVAALRDAHRDLLVHQVAMMAGMRAAVFELFSRLGPEAAESAEGPPQGASRLPWVRTAALWERHRRQHAQLLENLDDDFEAIFGREFLRAYEAQSRADADAGRSWPDPPWPGAR